MSPVLLNPFFSVTVVKVKKGVNKGKTLVHRVWQELGDNTLNTAWTELSRKPTNAEIKRLGWYHPKPQQIEEFPR